LFGNILPLHGLVQWVKNRLLSQPTLNRFPDPFDRQVQRSLVAARRE
jgi:hypothetical protein